MKTCLEVDENWKDRIEDLITFSAQDYLLNLQEKMNRLKGISSYLRTHFFFEWWFAWHRWYRQRVFVI